MINLHLGLICTYLSTLIYILNPDDLGDSNEIKEGASISINTIGTNSETNTTEALGEIEKSQKRRRMSNKKCDDGMVLSEEEHSNSLNGGVSAAQIIRKNSEEFASSAAVKTPAKRPLSGASTGGASESKDAVVKSPKISLNTSKQGLARGPLTTNRSRISIAFSAEKISRILMRALQVFGPLSATQCTQLINKKRKPNVEVRVFFFREYISTTIRVSIFVFYRRFH